MQINRLLSLELVRGQLVEIGVSLAREEERLLVSVAGGL